MVNPNSGVIGALVIGVALVGGAYLMQNFGQGEGQFGEMQPQDFAVANEPMPRQALSITDTNQDGIEDWREEFLTGGPVRQTAPGEEYVAPETLTGRMGIRLMEQVIIKQNPMNNLTKEDIADILAREALKETGDTLYTAEDVTVVSDTPENIRAYGNGAALALKNNAIIVSSHELNLLDDYVQRNNEAARAELEQLRESVRSYRDGTLALPVPQSLLKPHLDLINVYNAIYNNFDVFVNANEDPLLSLVRLQRYVDDMRALNVALENMYWALATQTSAFEADDPVVLFAKFAESSGV